MIRHICAWRVSRTIFYIPLPCVKVLIECDGSLKKTSQQKIIREGKNDVPVTVFDVSCRGNDHRRAPTEIFSGL